MRIKSFSFLLALSFVFLLFGCSKPDIDIDNSIPNNTPFDETTLKGNIYLDQGKFMLNLDLQTGSVIYQAKLLNINGGYESEINFDSGYYYHRDYAGVTCYDASNGSVVWGFNWLSYNNIQFSTAVILNDSSIFFSSPTSVWQVAYLYCLDKRTGELKWKVKIDEGGYPFYYSFYSIPVLIHDKVVTLARDANGDRKLISFNVSNGEQVWESSVNDELKATLKTDGEKIYSTGQYAYCYNGDNGTLEWEKNLQLVFAGSSLFGNISFFDKNELVIAGVYSTPSNTVIVLDSKTGNADYSFTTDINFHNCNYKNGVFYALGNVNDTVELDAIDIKTHALKWKYRPYLFNKTPLITDKNVMFAAFDIDSTMTSSIKLFILDLNGKLVRKIPLPVERVDKFIYVDDKKKFYRQLEY
jgi:outer membrane protein assembly factor BamB